VVVPHYLAIPLILREMMLFSGYESIMKIKNSDILRVNYKGYMEPVLLDACTHQAQKTKARTRSKYIRYAVIRSLIQDGYPLNRISHKFDAFYKSMGYIGE